jgi:hypothetical protein
MNNDDAMASLERLKTPEIMLPQQYYGALVGLSRGDGARDLMLAVLEDGIRNLCHQQNGKDCPPASIVRRGQGPDRHARRFVSIFVRDHLRNIRYRAGCPAPTHE